MIGNKGHLTAITRNTISRPLAELFMKGLLPEDKSTLDFGCGKGFDAEQLKLDMYDPYFYPEYPNKKYDIITCNYVLNVLTATDVVQVLKEIRELLNDNGVAYITVRRDIKTEGITKRGTLQRNVVLNLPKVKETSAYCIYKWEVVNG